MNTTCPDNHSAVKPVTTQLLQLTDIPSFDVLPQAVLAMAKHCLLDWAAVSIRGAREAMVSIQVEEALERQSSGSIIIPGRSETLNLIDAALVTGTAAHALDFDDGNIAGGHLTTPIASAVMALAQHVKADGKSVLAAFVAGYEFAARVGYLISPGHYARGFHPTATIGPLGAARACAHLLRLNDTQTCNALGIAATQAAGLVASFGTMCKPLHVGRAAANGLLATRLAERGYTGNEQVLDHAYGFVHAHGDNFNSEKATLEPPQGYFILDNVFKYHASCAGTHASIDGLKRLLDERPISVEEIASVDVHLHPRLDKVCNIATPKSGLEIKFSIRTTTAATLAGLPTADPAMFSDETAADETVVALRDRTRVVPDASLDTMASKIRIVLTDGSVLEADCPASGPESDSDNRGRKLLDKYYSLTTSVIKNDDLAQLASDLDNFEKVTDVTGLLQRTQTLVGQPTLNS